MSEPPTAPSDSLNSEFSSEYIRLHDLFELAATLGFTSEPPTTSESSNSKFPYQCAVYMNHFNHSHL